MSLRLLKQEDAHQFKPLLAEIEEDPGNPLGPVTFWLVVAVFVFFLGWTIFGEIDVVVSARGKVIPAGEVKVLQPLNGGVVSGILVKEGDYVKKGQTLVVIDPSTTAPQLESSQKTLAHVQQEQARLQATAGQGSFSDGNGTQERLYQAALQSLENQLQAKEKALSSLDQQIQAKQVDVKHTQETLQIAQAKEVRLKAVMDIIAKDDYEKVQTEILTSENKLKELSHELSQLSFQQAQTREEMGFLQQDFESRTLNELSEKEKQATQLKANIEEASFKNARQNLVAPADGYIHELFVHTVGGVVTPAQKVISLVPVNTPLTIQSIVQNKDIGFIKVGMPVAIKIDTYDFQKYGTLKGKITQIDKDSRDDQKMGPVYTVYVTPLQHSLLVEGKRQNLSSGLSLTSEIKVGKRHIIEFFIYPLIKHLDEGMSVR